MWKVVTSSNLNPLLKLFFYSPILSNNNPLLKIYCENIVVAFLNCNFLFFILFFPSHHLDTFLLLLLLFFSWFFLHHPRIPLLSSIYLLFFFSSSSFQIISSTLSFFTFSISTSIFFPLQLTSHTHTHYRHGLRLSFFYLVLIHFVVTMELR